jgi:hypothetical protein
MSGVSCLLLGPLFFDFPQILDKFGFAFEQPKDCVGCFALDYLAALPANDNLRPLAQKLLELGLRQPGLFSNGRDSLRGQQAELLSHFIFHGNRHGMALLGR